MKRQDYIDKTAEMIARYYRGRQCFSIAQAANVLGISEVAVPARLKEAGVKVTMHGKKRFVTALGLAECMYNKQESPIVKRRMRTSVSTATKDLPRASQGGAS